jgi:hypothetical protein
MAYCNGKKQAKVQYNFSEGEQDVYIDKFPPIDVFGSSLDENQFISKTFDFTFDGQSLSTQSFECVAPLGTPEIAEVFLISGVWDDYGSIGSYRSTVTYGAVARYDGPPLKIGTGLRISGTATNLIAGGFGVSVTVKWQWLGISTLRISRNGTNVFETSGKGKLTFEVTCDDDCPEGHIRCESSGYPGYCCIPCTQLLQQINNLIRKI